MIFLLFQEDSVYRLQSAKIFIPLQIGLVIKYKGLKFFGFQETPSETNFYNFFRYLLLKFLSNSLTTLVKESFVELGLQRKVPGKEGKEHDLIIYRKGFETPFLKETEEYYKKESNEFISSNSVVDYLVKVEKRFDEE